ncbi:hypothetical protein ACTXT7_004879 [Hymenolepis weldensis]
MFNDEADNEEDDNVVIHIGPIFLPQQLQHVNHQVGAFNQGLMDDDNFELLEDVIVQDDIDYGEELNEEMDDNVVFHIGDIVLPQPLQEVNEEIDYQLAGLVIGQNAQMPHVQEVDLLLDEEYVEEIAKSSNLNFPKKFKPRLLLRSKKTEDKARGGFIAILINCMEAVFVILNCLEISNSESSECTFLVVLEAGEVQGDEFPSYVETCEESAEIFEDVYAQFEGIAQHVGQFTDEEEDELYYSFIYLVKIRQRLNKV